ncbi:MAG: SEC-C metal-binding domain-containing protein, partial [Pseudomonadota bacterium]
HAYLNLELPVVEWGQEEGIEEEAIIERITDASDDFAKKKFEEFGDEIAEYVEKSVMLQTLDHLWREHLVNLDHLRSVVGFRGYAQRDPLQEYKSESFELFQTMLANLRQAVTAQMMRVELVQQNELSPQELAQMQGEEEQPDDIPYVDPETIASWGRVSRNAPCPCGSGKKYKHCHGRLA